MKEDNVIDMFLEELNKPTRATKGRDTTKNYHKITISVSQSDKIAIQAYSQDNSITVSALIKSLLHEKGIIDKWNNHFKYLGTLFLCSCSDFPYSSWKGS